jgi:hypothetical protein
VIFSVIFYGEQLTRGCLRFGLLFFAVIISETKLSFLRRKKPAALPGGHGSKKG